MRNNMRRKVGFSMYQNISCVTVGALVVVLCLAFTSKALAAPPNEWNINGSGDWNFASNWSDGTVPAGERVKIASNGTVDLSIAATTDQLVIGSEFSGLDPGGGVDGPHAGFGTLNILPGADLTIGGSGFVLGEFDDDGTLDSMGTVNQSGGTVTVNSSAFTIGTTSSSGLYSMSGGTLNVSSSVTPRMDVGFTNAGQGGLKVIGSESTINIDTLLQFGNFGSLAVEFDSGGVSAVVANDVVIWGAGNNLLEVVLGPTAAFNNGDVFPILQGLNSLNSGQFGSLAEGAIIQIDGFDTFQINYKTVTANAVTLTALRTVAIPEPRAIALLGMGILAMLSRRSIRK